MRSPVFLLLLACGCSYYYPLTHAQLEKGIIPSETSVRITRQDSSIIESGAFRHALVKESSDFVMGVGSERKSGRPFAGTVQRSEIDSLHLVHVNDSRQGEQTYLVCWLTNGTTIGFAEQDVLTIAPDQEPGLWCRGTLHDKGVSKPFTGKIDPATIRLIEEEKIGVFHPTLPTSGGREADQFLWFTLGIGAGPGPEQGHEPPAFLVAASALSKASLYSARFTAAFTVPFLAFDHPPAKFSVLELAALYGLAFKSRPFLFSISAGVSYVWGSEEIALMDPAGIRTLSKSTFSFGTVSFPLDIEGSILVTSHFGISLKYFSTSNSRKSWHGGVLCLQLGNL